MSLHFDNFLELIDLEYGSGLGCKVFDSGMITVTECFTTYINLTFVVVRTVCGAVPLPLCGGRPRTWSSTAWSPRSPEKLSSLLLSPRLLICGLWLSGLRMGQSLCGGVVGGDGPGPVLHGLHALGQDCPPCYYHPDRVAYGYQDCVWGSPSAVVWWEGTDLVQYCMVSTFSGKITTTI
jgi:hypothetical protein